ncbi:MAG: N-acetylmuramoyl-L-alanine amidase [Elusimicrobiota bacterium]|nr:N-acetylmuramoyl-L-alanine amidase [Elusimicrobiota bacterium]
MRRTLAALVLVVGALSAPARASDMGAAVAFPGLPLKRAVALPRASAEAVLFESGDSVPLEAPFIELLVRGEAAPGALRVEASVHDGTAWGPWTAVTDGEADAAGTFWYRFSLSGPAGAAVRLRAVGGADAPAWILLRAVDAVHKDPGSAAASGASALGGTLAAPPPLGGAPRGSGPPEPVVRPRADWGAAAAVNPYEMMIPGGISVHHTETDSPRGEAAAARLLRSIQSFHQRGRGWSDVAYHFLIDADGRVWQGRPGPVVGAHVRDRNDGNIGIALMGDFEDPAGRQPTPQQMEALHALAAWLVWRYDMPVTRILAHSHQEQTACPGAALFARLPSVRAEVAARVAAADPVAGVSP